MPAGRCPSGATTGRKGARCRRACDDVRDQGPRRARVVTHDRPCRTLQVPRSSTPVVWLCRRSPDRGVVAGVDEEHARVGARQGIWARRDPERGLPCRAILPRFEDGESRSLGVLPFARMAWFFWCTFSGGSSGLGCPFLVHVRACGRVTEPARVWQAAACSRVGQAVPDEGGVRLPEGSVLLRSAGLLGAYAPCLLGDAGDIAITPAVYRKVRALGLACAGLSRTRLSER